MFYKSRDENDKTADLNHTGAVFCIAFALRDICFVLFHKCILKGGRRPFQLPFCVFFRTFFGRRFFTFTGFGFACGFRFLGRFSFGFRGFAGFDVIS